MFFSSVLLRHRFLVFSLEGEMKERKERKNFQFLEIFILFRRLTESTNLPNAEETWQLIHWHRMIDF